MNPRSSKMTSGRSREASGSDFVRISEEFTSNARRPRRSQLKPPGAGRVAAAQGHKRSYGLAVSILGRLSPLSPCCCSLSCRSCSCCSCCSFCPRLACNACTPSSLTRFPFHDSQVFGFHPVIYEEMAPGGLILFGLAKVLSLIEKIWAKFRNRRACYFFAA